jgi:hypothetical protein
LNARTSEVIFEGGKIMPIEYEHETIIGRMSPLAGANYTAKLGRVFKTENGIRTEIGQPFGGEWWGMTEQEARTKLGEAFDDWIAQQPNAIRHQWRSDH